jgi:hypothetical protein
MKKINVSITLLTVPALIFFVAFLILCFCGGEEAPARKSKIDFGNEYFLREYYFNGNEYIGITKAPKIEKDITISCFFKPEKEAFKNGAYLICRWKDSGYQSYAVCLSDVNHIKVWLLVCADYSKINHEVELTLKNTAKNDEWQHIAVTYDGKDVKAYYNGKLDSDKIFSGQIVSPKAPDLILGAKENFMDFTKTGLYKGALRNVHIYNRTLSEDEIQKLYESDRQAAETPGE